MAALKSPIINVMERAARRAARGLVRDFGELENLQTSRKGAADFVTAADVRSERVIREELLRARPDYGMLAEEGGASHAGDGVHRWIVDPLDGTLNFMHGLPQFAISIALERDDEIVAATIYEPVHDELYWSERNGGAFLNDRRLRVSSRRDLTEVLVATGIPFKGRGDHDEYLRTLQTIIGATAGVRRFGAAALDLAFVASGRFDGFWEFGLNAWDIAAGILLVREAGGFATDVAGGTTMLESGDVVAGNSEIHRQLLQLLAASRDAID